MSAIETTTTGRVAGARAGLDVPLTDAAVGNGTRRSYAARCSCAATATGLMPPRTSQNHACPSRYLRRTMASVIPRRTRPRTYSAASGGHDQRWLPRQWQNGEVLG